MDGLQITRAGIVGVFAIALGSLFGGGLEEAREEYSPRAAVLVRIGAATPSGRLEEDVKDGAKEVAIISGAAKKSSSESRSESESA